MSSSYFLSSLRVAFLALINHSQVSIYPLFGHVAPDDEAAPFAEFFVVALDLFNASRGRKLARFERRV